MSVYAVTYNGISFYASTIDNFEETDEYADDGTDVLYKKVSITIRGLMNICVNPDGVTNAALLNNWKQTLLEPRKQLTFSIDGVQVINQGPDAKNGPLPSYVKIGKIIGNTLLVDFSVDTWTLACETTDSSSTPGQPINPVISNRWNQTQDLDASGMSTLTTTGTFVVASSAKVNPDTLRNNIFPLIRLAVGFTRERQEFNVSSDGNTYSYTIVDVEKYRPPTDPITEWNGTWTESSSSMGNITEGTLSVWVKGKKTTSKTQMMTFLGNVIRSRIYRYDIPRTYSIQEGLSENTISFNMTVQCLSNKATSATQGQDGKILFQMTVIPGENGVLTTTSRIGNKVFPIDGAAQNTFTVISTRGCYLINLFFNKVNGSCEDKMGTVPLTDATNQNPTFYGTACSVNVTPVTTAQSSQTTASAAGAGGGPGTVQFPYIYQDIQEQYAENHKSIGMAQAYSLGANPAAENQNSTIINTGAAGTKRYVKFVLRRLNAVPEIPYPSINGQPVAAQNIKVNTSSPELLISGVDYIHTLSGSYEYVQPLSQQIASNAGIPLVVPASPVANQPRIPINPVIFVNNLVG